MRRAVPVVVAVALALVIGVMAWRWRDPIVPTRPIAAVLRDKAPEWMALDGVVSVAEGRRQGAPCLLVLATGPVELPAMVEGYPIVVEHTDPIVARDGR